MFQPFVTQNKSKQRLATFKKTSASTLISDPCWRTEGLQAIDLYNEELLEIVDEIRAAPFFKLYSVNMMNGCNYFPQGIDECESQSCELYPVDLDGKNFLI